MIDIIISWISDTIGDLLNSAIAFFSPLLGFSFQRFVNTFPYANTVYLIFQRCGLVIVLIVAVVQLFGWFFPSSERSRIPPTKTAFSVILAVGFIYFGNYLLQGILNLCMYPYEAIMEGSTEQNGIVINANLGSLLYDSFAGLLAVLYIIIFAMIAWAFMKLLLESIERYIVLFLLIYASPLASATLASEATKDIYKKFLTMFVSQCILMILNIWILKLCISMFENLGASAPEEKPLALLLGWGLLKIGSRLDSYVNQLGLNAAVTGTGLASEIGAVAGGLMASAGLTAGAISGGKFGGGPSGGRRSGGLWGAARSVATTVDKYNPMSAVGRGAVNYGSAMLKSTVGKDGLVGAAINRIKGNAPAPKGSWQQNFQKNMKAASLKTQEENVWARALAGKDRKAAVGNIGNNSATSIDRANTAKYSHIADQAFKGAAAGNAVVTEPADVGAVMQGIGFENTFAGAEGFTAAAYGNGHAENVDFKMDTDGIQASYTQDGKTHSTTILSEEQHGALPFEKQEGYTSFTSDNGNTYFYKVSSEQAPRPATEAQKAAADFSAKAQTFTGKNGETMSAKDYAYMAKHPATVNQVFSGLQESGVTIQDQKQVGYMLQAMQTPGIPAKTKSDAVNSLFAEEADRARMDGNGMHISYTGNDGKQNSITMLTEQRMNELGADYVANRGFNIKNIDGQQYGFLYEKNGDAHDFSPSHNETQQRAATPNHPQNHGSPSPANVPGSINGKDQKPADVVMTRTEEQAPVNAVPTPKIETQPAPNVESHSAFKAEPQPVPKVESQPTPKTEPQSTPNFRSMPSYEAQQPAAIKSVPNTNVQQELGGNVQSMPSSSVQPEPDFRQIQNTVMYQTPDFSYNVNRNNELMSSQDYAYMAQHPETINQVFSGLQESGTAIQDQKQVGYMLQAMQTPGIPEQAKSDAFNALNTGRASHAQIDGNGMQISYTGKDGKQNNITMLTEQRMNELGADYVAKRGFQIQNIDGTQYGFLHEKNRTKHNFGSAFNNGKLN